MLVNSPRRESRLKLGSQEVEAIPFLEEMHAIKSLLFKKNQVEKNDHAQSRVAREDGMGRR
jgi:hypothetical protein